jgi:polyisoprenoid-binding protein YceI
MATTDRITTLLPTGIWRLDPVHSTIGFEVRDMAQLVATIRGRFTDYEGVLEVDENRARASGAIRTASVTTDHEQRDEDLRSEHYLDAAQYPQIRFESDDIVPLDAGKIQILGRLELKGEEQPLELEARVLGTGRDQAGQQRLAIAGEGELAFGPMQVKLVVDVSSLKQP